MERKGSTFAAREAGDSTFRAAEGGAEKSHTEICHCSTPERHVTKKPNCTTTGKKHTHTHKLKMAGERQQPASLVDAQRKYTRSAVANTANSRPKRRRGDI